jgi:hypothetical protein
LKKNYFSSYKLPKQQLTSFWSQGILGVNATLAASIRSFEVILVLQSKELALVIYCGNFFGGHYFTPNRNLLVMQMFTT